MTSAAIHFSPWIFVALPVAAATGVGVLLLQMSKAGASVGVACKAIRARRNDVTTMMLFDIVGAALGVAGILLFGVSQPHGLVVEFQVRPVLAWAIVGALGPLVSAGLLDRLPIRDWVGGGSGLPATNADNGTNAGRVSLAEVRMNSARNVLDELDTRLIVIKRIARDRESIRASKLIRDGHLSFQEIVDEICEFLDAEAKGIPDGIATILRLRQEALPTTVSQEESEALIEVALRVGLTKPLRISCDAAEERRRESLSPVS